MIIMVEKFHFDLICLKLQKSLHLLVIKMSATLIIERDFSYLCLRDFFRLGANIIGKIRVIMFSNFFEDF